MVRSFLFKLFKTSGLAKSAYYKIVNAFYNIPYYLFGRQFGPFLVAREALPANVGPFRAKTELCPNCVPPSINLWLKLGSISNYAISQTEQVTNIEEEC